MSRQVVFQEAGRIQWLDSRFYRRDVTNIDYPSVTTILDAYPKEKYFYEWLKAQGGNADSIRDSAAESGSKVHQAIDDYNKGVEIFWANEEGKAQYTLEEWKMFCKAMDFLKLPSVNMIATEAAYVSDTLGYGGTIDCIAEIDGVLTLIDFKTSNYISDTHWIQLECYFRMFNEKNPHMALTDFGILHLKAQTRGEDKKGKVIQGKGWQLKMRPEEKSHDHLWNLYKATRVLWEEMNGGGARPLNQVFPSSFKK